MTLARSIFGRFSHVWHRWQLLSVGPSRGNRLLIDQASSYVASIMSEAAHPDMAPSCAAAAKKHFSLDEGVRRYAFIYQQLGARA